MPGVLNTNKLCVSPLFVGKEQGGKASLVIRPGPTGGSLIPILIIIICPTFLGGLSLISIIIIILINQTYFWIISLHIIARSQLADYRNKPGTNIGKPVFMDDPGNRLQVENRISFDTVLQ